VLTEPADLSAAVVLDVVREHWDAAVLSVAYRPQGAGAHHWVASGRRHPRWFVTADDVNADGRLAELLDAYAAARELADRGHHAVVPTVAPRSEPAVPREREVPAVGVVAGDAYLVTVTTYLEGEPGPGEYADDNQRALIAGALGALHADQPPHRARAWTPGPPRRAELGALLRDLDRPWAAGPFGESVRQALRRSGRELGRLYQRFDELAATALDRRDTWVVTHGEPHTANVLWRSGGPVLVDWESLRVAPRERDLRTVLRGADGAEPLSAYVAHGGTADLDDDMVELFDLEWWLWEIAEYAVRFHARHDGDGDDARFHQAFLEEVVPAVDRAVSKETAR
jgi:spectinomycin phosphotransferase